MSLYREAARLLGQGQPCLMATVVRASGSAPQGPGARLLVRGDGSTLGTLGGGCVEAEVWAEAMRLLGQGGGAKVDTFHLNEELDGGEGLVCGGTMFILLEPLGVKELSWVEGVAVATEGGPSVATATPLAEPYPGAKLLIAEDGSLSGSLRDPDLDALARSWGLNLIATRESRAEFVIAQGAEFFLEAFTAPPTLLVLGAGHIGYALGRLAQALGFRVVVVDDRAEFANRDRFPQAQEVIAAPFPQAIPPLPLTLSDAIVVATRGHKHDFAALEAACRTPARYVAVVGSRRKAVLLSRALLRAGVAPERVGEVRCPAGLHIGARTPEEIALSILAEILMVRRGGDGQPLRIPGQAQTSPLPRKVIIKEER